MTQTERAESQPSEPSSGAPSPSATTETLISVKDLKKTFNIGFFKSRVVEAVKGVTFDVHRGEIFGFLGPNGAGKTTTIKMLTGLIAPTSGDAYLFGKRVPAAEARQNLGFLPENPYVYPYLTPREVVEMSGQLSGMKGAALRSRTMEVLTKLGIAYAADRQARRLSKGMLQRTGLAAALVADPELLILDEPMSGLDPVGRKEVRDLIFDECAQGRTIFFSTHILSDVEAICDRVAILREGKVVVMGALRNLLRGDVVRTEITLANVSLELRQTLLNKNYEVTDRAGVVVVAIDGEAQVPPALRMALDAGAQVIELVPKKETLEDLFIRRAL
ncbi:MAG: ABC transporter ATP-binding protein [Polyangiaceae bacterium]|nr:ABC transporter ATP-binding protein [Polyangiaceae bacterium]